MWTVSQLAALAIFDRHSVGEAIEPQSRGSKLPGAVIRAGESRRKKCQFLSAN
jgi:hypothetical protein